MSDLFGFLDSSAEFNEITEKIKSGKCPIHITGMTGSQKSHFIYSICRGLDKNCIVITYDEQEAGRISKDLSFLFSREVSVFKSKEYVYYNIDASNNSSEVSRIRALYKYTLSNPLVTTVDACQKFTIPPSVFKNNIFSYKTGDTIDISKLAEKLVNIGYRRTSAIDGIGQFSIRGSIVDVFSPCLDNPVRIDLFDDEIDSIRVFDPYTQISIENIEECHICPVREVVYSKEKSLEIASSIRKLKNENLLKDAEKFENFSYFASLDKYMPYAYDNLCTLLDYADDNTLIFVDEAKQISERSKVIYKEHAETVTSLLEKGLFPRTKRSYMLDYSELIEKINPLNMISVSSLSHSCPSFSPLSLFGITAKTIHSYTGKAEFLYDDLKYFKKIGYRVLMLFGNETALKIMHRSLTDEGIEASVTDINGSFPDFGQIYLCVGNLCKGFEYPTIKTIVISDGEESRKPKKIPKRKKDSRDIIKSFEDLNQGDYVVHRTHGIGRYVGIAQLNVDNVTRDYLKIQYKGSDILYVPTNQLDFLHKYTDSENERVKVNSLGGVQWNRTVARVKESVTELAQDLIELYAKRSELKGHVFPPDTPWQKEFEEKFIYEETPDQIRSIQEVKKDMENGKCMDRLLCGDVGYGKTEVAIRAAFKCVMEGMQVAYLVPTTILAQQHFNNFSARLGEYAMKVEMLSRFRTKKQQEKTVEGLKSGSVDVVIGTHRLLQKDVKFKNLGLLIIDEEQRFGVGHKEKIKEIKSDVDVLTLSATPIPRTLNMAMVGIRDLSVLSQPPGDRYPVQTFVMEYNEAVIVNAIKREMERKGQVYYLYNRIDGIENAAAKIQDMIPDARVAIAHGKMSESQLEEIMMSLIEGEIDVLVCTTIIETGLDVSNVNTIIIENSDRLGLSQLYQLRGRVGRSNRMAYAYLTYHPGKILDQVAHKRLQAIKEFTEFGSGFKIAMRDLEIRGAGNLLGKQQHGNMNLVGYDMYCMLLEQAVKEKKGEEYRPPAEISVDIKADAYIPDNYVEYEIQRIDLYKKIAGIESDEDYYDMQGEFIDRFGDIPAPVSNLLDISLIKSMCKKAEVSEIVHTDGKVTFTFTDYASPEAVVGVVSEYSREMKFVSGAKSSLIYKCPKDAIENIKIILQKLIKLTQGS
ncbi:MAG: transcription-repair coupling factor [Ruminococcaceae bacterium]|nr:transcription-repair coupling factor [Oscillospiraceae bacterium]